MKLLSRLASGMRKEEETAVAAAVSYTQSLFLIEKHGLLDFPRRERLLDLYRYKMSFPAAVQK